MKVYTRDGDDGSTGLFYGGRVAKDSLAPEAYGTVDEAQAFLGLARVQAEAGSELDEILVGVERDLYVLMAELATAVENHHKLEPGVTRVTPEMVTALETTIDDLSTRFDPPTEFVIPGENPVSAALEVARTVVRRAERRSVPLNLSDSSAVAYLNRLSDMLWTMARWQEGESLTARSVEPRSSS